MLTVKAGKIGISIKKLLAKTKYYLPKNYYAGGWYSS